MKITQGSVWQVIAAAVLASATMIRASADLAVPTAGPELHYTGTIVSVDQKERRVAVKGGAWSKKRFNLGDKCAYSFLYDVLRDNDRPLNDLRPGQKVTVSYQEVHGALMADRIEQQPMELTGTVRWIDPEQHALIVHGRIWGRRFQIGGDCITVLPGDKAGTLGDIHSGDRVKVTYETPGGRATAWQITKAR